MAFIYLLIYLCLLASLIAIGALLICSLIEAIKERHGAKVKDTETEYYTRLKKELQKKIKAQAYASRLQRKQARKERRERERKRRKFEREERRFKRALDHIDKGWSERININTPNNGTDL